MSKKNYYTKNDSTTEGVAPTTTIEEKETISLRDSLVETTIAPDKSNHAPETANATRIVSEEPVTGVELSTFSDDLDVKIKLLANGQMPSLGSKNAAAYDCYAAEDYDIDCFDKAVKVRLGFSMQLPDGYHAKLFIRSGIAANTQLRLANAVGIIDSDYRGEVCALIETNPLWIARGATYNAYLNYQLTSVHIDQGDRICQMIIEKNLPVKLTQVDTLDESERGEGGFGSSGTK